MNNATEIAKTGVNETNATVTESAVDGTITESSVDGTIEPEARERVTVAPRVDVFEHSDAYLLVTGLPGVRVEDLDVTYEGETLAVSGSSTATSDLGELRQGHDVDVAYSRAFRIPGIDSEQIEARMDRGVLRVHLPKSAARRPRQIAVQSS